MQRPDSLRSHEVFLWCQEIHHPEKWKFNTDLIKYIHFHHLSVLATSTAVCVREKESDRKRERLFLMTPSLLYRADLAIMPQAES